MFKQVFISFVTSTIAIILLLGLKLWFDTTTLGTQIQEAGYNFSLSLLHDDAADRITIVDIGNLPQQNGVTSREALTQLLTAICDKSPAVVGLDVDFGPRPDGYMDPKEDPGFFQFCQDMSHRGDSTNRASVPIVVGIYRSRELSPEWWLGPENNFSRMAANIGVDADDTRFVPIWTRITRDQAVGAKGKSLSYVLAEEYLRASGDDSSRDKLAALRRMFDQGDMPLLTRVSPEERPCEINLATQAHEPCNYQSGNTLVDYSPLPRLEDLTRVVRWNELVNVTTLQGKTHTRLNDLSAARFSALFAKKIVLIGNAGYAPLDVFSVPHSRFHLGVFLHGCATATLTDKPLWEFTQTGQRLIDLLTSVAILGGVMMLRLLAIRRSGKDLNSERLHAIFTFIAILTIFIQFVLINQLRLIWDDFLVVAFALLLHSFAEKQVTKTGKWFTKACNAVKNYVETEAVKKEATEQELPEATSADASAARPKVPEVMK